MISDDFAGTDHALNGLLPDDFDHAHFLREYWQKRPLLIRANGEFEDPLTPEELAGLACEDFVESRLVTYLPEMDDWQAEMGPFEEQHFLELPEENYSLLVQAVDQWFPEVHELIGHFGFLPAWRLDDVMVSYSTEGGNVGPHFDYYDVFLVQGMGRKQWQLGQHCDASSPLRHNNAHMKLLRDFYSEESIVVEPGDILYVPPGLAHYGLALEPCITYSVGFRAPSASDLLQELAPAMADSCPEDLRFQDEVDMASLPVGEIPESTVTQLQRLLRKALDQPDAMHQWFAHYMTAPRYPEAREFPEAIEDIETFRAQLATWPELHKSPSARFAWIRQNGNVLLFADGQGMVCDSESLPVIQALCDPTVHSLDNQTLLREAHCLELVRNLYNQGSLIIIAEYYS